MTDFFRDKVTIFNSVPASQIKNRSFGRFVIEKCQIQGGFVDKTDGTVRNIVNAKTVITKDIGCYLPPEEYYSTPEDMRSNFFTAQTGDFVVFDEVEDVVQNAAQFAELQQKYKNNGIVITTVDAAINGMRVDNITMTNA